MARISQTAHNRMVAYALALEEAGLRGAIQTIQTLLDDGYQEKFADYFPDARAFGVFCERFRTSRLESLEHLGWKFDAEKIYADPSHEQSILDYYRTVFEPAIRRES